MQNDRKYAAIFFGTPDFAATILAKLAGSPYKPILAITAPDQRIGRTRQLTSPLTKVLAQKYHIAVAQPEKLSLIKQQIIDLRPDILIVAAYGKIIPQSILDIPLCKALNVHPSLLPLWRGASPIQSAILAGDAKTGVTIMQMDAQMDHGPLIANNELRIKNTDTTETLTRKLAELGATLLLETLPRWIMGKIVPREQNHERATYSKIITRDDGHINWQKPAKEIERMIRAFIPWPGSYTFWEGKRVKIHSAKIKLSNASFTQTPATVFFSNGTLAIQTGNGILIPTILQLEGKTVLGATEFMRGYPKFISAVLA